MLNFFAVGGYAKILLLREERTSRAAGFVHETSLSSLSCCAVLGCRLVDVDDNIVFVLELCCRLLSKGYAPVLVRALSSAVCRAIELAYVCSNDR